MRALALAILIVFAVAAPAQPALSATSPAALAASSAAALSPAKLAAAKRRVLAKRRCLKRAKTKAARRRCVAPAKKKQVVKKPGVAAPVVATTPAPVVPTPAPTPDVPVETAPVTTAPTVTAPAAPACDPSPWIKATAEDAGGAFRLRLSRDCLPAGRVLFSFLNTDAQPHNLWIAGVSPAVPATRVIDDTDGGATGAADMTAGTWRVYCSILGHEAMTKTISVTAP